MNRHEAEAKMLEHLAAIVEIAREFDPDTNYVTAWAFVKSNAGMVTNNKSGKYCIDKWTDKLIDPEK